MTQVRRVGRADPMYFIGDSSTMAFQNRLYKDKTSNRTFIGRSVFLPGLYAADMCDSNGNIHPHVIANLATENLIVADGSGRWTAFRWDLSITTHYVAKMTGADLAQPPIVISCGGFDGIRLLEEIGEAEIDLPGFLPPTPGHPSRYATHCSFEDACKIARPYLEPYGRAMLMLRSFGLTNLFIHDLAPTERDDDEFRRYFASGSTIRSRLQCGIVMNFVIREFANRAAIPFIELWPKVTTPDGYRDRRFSRDVVHLNSRAAMLTVGAVLEHLNQTAASRTTRRTRTVASNGVDDLGLVDDSYDFDSIREPIFED
jgi:hypothetical protein